MSLELGEMAFLEKDSIAFLEKDSIMVFLMFHGGMVLVLMQELKT
jgi:hypothetical protein